MVEGTLIELLLIGVVPDKLLDVSEKPTVMYIRGKLADWKLTDRGLKSQGQQNVSTYVWT